MRIGKYIIFERVETVDELKKAITAAQEKLDDLKAAHITLFKGSLDHLDNRLKKVEGDRVRVESVVKLLDACKGLDSRISKLESMVPNN